MCCQFGCETHPFRTANYSLFSISAQESTIGYVSILTVLVHFGLEIPVSRCCAVSQDVSRCLKFQTGLIDARSIRSRIQNDTKRFQASRCQSVSCLSGTFRAVLGRSTLPASYPWRLRRFWSLPQRGWTWRQKPQPSGQAVWKITENNQFCLVRLIGDVKSK